MITEDQFEELQVYVASMFYYLYRKANSPLGDSPMAYDTWVQTQMLAPFNELSERMEEEDNE